MTTNPEQEARAAVRARIADKISSAISQALGAADEGVDGNWPAIDAALARLCTERYFAGKVAGLRKEWECTCPYGGRTVRNFRKCLRCKRVDEAEAEYAACVAALQEAKHG